MTLTPEQIDLLIQQADGLAPKEGSIFRALVKLTEAEVRGAGVGFTGCSRGAAGINQGKPMTKPELIRLMRLLSGMESILLFSGMQHLNQRAHIPDYLLEELTALTEVLEREILK